MFNYTYTPTSNDSSWIGLNKAASESGYIAVSYLNYCMVHLVSIPSLGTFTCSIINSIELFN